MKLCYTLTRLDAQDKIRSCIRFLVVTLLFVTCSLPAPAQGGGEIRFGYR